MLIVQLELMEHGFARNDGVAKLEQLEVYQRTVNTTRRLLERLQDCNDVQNLYRASTTIWGSITGPE